MKTAVLFSGGKDSCLAMYKAMKEHEVVCLITIFSSNPASYMFHTPNIAMARVQAKAIGLPIVTEKTRGEKEKELDDLERAIERAKEKYKIEAIVTGALASNYQASRIQKICDKLGLKCINPLWQMDQFKLLDDIIKLKFNVIVVGTFAEGLENFLGRKIDAKFIEDIKKVHEKHKIHVAGEGGEFETLTLDAPFFKKKLVIQMFGLEIDENNGRIMHIAKTKLVDKS